jgi:hypothetical protein
MRRTSTILSFAAVAALACGHAVSAQSKNSAERAKPADYDQLKGVKQLNGRVVAVDPSVMTITLRVEFSRLERNPNYRPPRISRGNRGYSSGASLAQIAGLVRQYQQALRNRNPVQRQQQIARVAQQMQRLQMQAAVRGLQQQARVVQQLARSRRNPNSQPVKRVTTPKDYDFVMREGVVLRKMFVREEFDDRGNIKRYTKDELARLRGTDSSIPGYAATFEELQPGQEVTLFLAAPAKTEGEAARPRVRMIVLTRAMRESEMALK